jgi:ubiquinone/menaquinone biosynthesis C-methylase UbiE
VKTYYDRRAREYDDWVFGTGLFAGRHRPGWHQERRHLERTIASLAPARTLDVACGTGWLTQHLPGEVTGLDASAGMLEIASERMPDAHFVVGDALELPFEDDSFDRVLTSHFYGHLEEEGRLRLLAEAQRVALELVVVDSALHEDIEPVQWQERELNDGSRWQVYKRYFTPEELIEELGSGRVLYAGTWFVAVAHEWA